MTGNSLYLDLRRAIQFSDNDRHACNGDRVEKQREPNKRNKDSWRAEALGMCKVISEVR